MAQTLDDVVLEQMQTNETLARVDRRLDNFITLWFSNKMDEMEMMRERIAAPAPAVPDGAPPAKDPTGLGFGFAAIVAGLTGAVIGFAAGFAETLNKLLKLVKIDIGAKFLKWSNSLKALFAEEGAIGKAVAKVKTFFKPMLDFFGRIRAFLGEGGALGKVFTSIKSFFQPIATFAEGFGATFSKFFQFFRVLGKIFLPLTAAIEIGMAIFNEMTNLGEGADVFDKFLGLAKGIIKGLYNIILMPLDLLKDGVSWLMEKMGFSNFSKLLDSFSFSDTFGKVVDTIFNVLEGFARGAVAAVMAIMPGGDSPAQAFMKEWNNVMSGGTGGASKAESAQISEGGADGEVAAAMKKVGDGGNKNNVSGGSEEQTADAIANAKTSAERISNSTMRDEISGQIGKESLAAAGGSATVNVTNVSNVNAPTTTQNNVQTSMMESILGNPTFNNNTRSGMYSW